MLMLASWSRVMAPPSEPPDRLKEEDPKPRSFEAVAGLTVRLTPPVRPAIVEFPSMVSVDMQSLKLGIHGVKAGVADLNIVAGRAFQQHEQ